MKRKVSIFALTLLLICTLSISFNTSLVKADAGGTGKYLTIEIVGQGSVNALKVKSGQTWDFPPNETAKVGAGTVFLTATAAEGWEFSYWEGDIAGTSETMYYKAVKYGYIRAVFVKTRFTITVSALGNGLGTLYLDGVFVDWGNFDFDYGETAVFTFEAIGTDYISSVAVDGICERSYVTEVIFSSIDADYMLDVYFSLEGTAFVPPGEGVVFLNPFESLEFDNAEGGGTATVVDLEEIADYPVGTLAAGWIIDVDFTFSGQVSITLQYDDTNLPEGVEESDLRLIRGETLEAVRSDVNGDLVVNGDDVSDVAWLNNEKLYEPWGDINNDGVVNKKDIHIVNKNKGAILENITDGPVNTGDNLIYGITDEFSIFGVHY